MKKLPAILLIIIVGFSSVRATPADADRLIHESRTALQQGDAKTAVELAEQATAADPARAEAFVQLGAAYGQRIGELNFMQQAIMSGKLRSAFEQAVALDPDNLGGRIGLVRYYANAPAIAGGSRARAEAEAEQVRQRNAFLGAMEHAFVAEKFQDPEAALQSYQEAIRLNPQHARAHHRAGVLHEQLGQLAEARAAYEQTLALDPKQTAAREALQRLAVAPTP